LALQPVLFRAGEISRPRRQVGIVADPLRGEIAEKIIDGAAGGIWRLLRRSGSLGDDSRLVLGNARMNRRGLHRRRKSNGGQRENKRAVSHRWPYHIGVSVGTGSPGHEFPLQQQREPSRAMTLMGRAAVKRPCFPYRYLRP
jgi:hypothetical protein